MASIADPPPCPNPLSRRIMTSKCSTLPATLSPPLQPTMQLSPKTLLPKTKKATERMENTKSNTSSVTPMRLSMVNFLTTSNGRATTIPKTLGSTKAIWGAQEMIQEYWPKFLRRLSRKMGKKKVKVGKGETVLVELRLALGVRLLRKPPQQQQVVRLVTRKAKSKGEFASQRCRLGRR